MCGVIGISSEKDLGIKLYYYLSKLQHRGQDCWGITDGQTAIKYKGLIKDNYCHDRLITLKNKYGIGHTRYLTQGELILEQSQPFIMENISFVHNGNIINIEELKNLLEENNVTLKTNSDSELLLQLLYLFYKTQRTFNTVEESIVESIKIVQKICKGSFFVIAMIDNLMVSFKDLNGIKPGMWYKHNNDIVITSENCGLSNNVHDIMAGDILIVDGIKVYSHKSYNDIKPCIFEYIYLAHPASTLYGVSVYNFRVKLADKLSELIHLDYDIDYVTIIPDSSRIYGIELSKKLNLDYKEVIIKNNYSIRTFIMPEGQRSDSVHKKFFFVEKEIKNKSILLVDDSIVRGTTSKYVIEKLRNYGAKKITMVSCAPIVKNYNCYGIKIDSKKELLSHNKSIDDMKTYLKCDELIFQSIENLYSTVPFKKLEDSIFT